MKSINAKGAITLEDGRIIPPEYRQFGRGYAVTSYASQGKTVDYVLFSDSAIKAATHAQQWYVSISRGRKGIRIFTADKEQLRENVGQSGERPLALDLLDSELPARKVMPQSHRFRYFPGIKTVRDYGIMVSKRIAAWAIIKRAKSKNLPDAQKQSH